jgi:hypothetical protein
MPLSADLIVRTKTRPIISFSIAFLLILIAGLIDLRKPFTGDQALFVTGARAMQHGSQLYRDFWDLKQPGIYWFFYLGTLGPGSAEVAVHLLELIYSLAFAGVIMATLRGYFQNFLTAALAAVLCCGVYFVICGPWHLTQVEGLVGFPLYVSAWLLLASPASEQLRWWKLFFAGVASAVVVLLKLMLLILPGCFLLLLLLSHFKYRKSVVRSFLAILIFGLGIGVVLIPLLLYYKSNHQIELIYQTFVEIPARITRELPHNSLVVFKSGFSWFLLRMGPLVVLSIVGFLCGPWDMFRRGMMIWVLAGLGLIVAQRMGWQYHFLLLLCPLAILSAGGFEALIASGVSWRRAIPIVLLLPYLGMESVQAVRQIKDQRPQSYDGAAKDVAIVSQATALPGPIYVVGDPLIYYLSNREQAIAINGWSPEWLLKNQWQEVATQLRVRRPVYIFVDWASNPSVALRGGPFIGVLNDLYHPAAKTSEGEWYALGKSAN